MSSIADFEFNNASLCDGVLLVTQEIRQNFPLADVRNQLQQLVDDARAAMPDGLNQDQQLEVLIDLFYRKWKFGGAGGVYRLSDAIWLDKVLDKRQGTPVSLGVIFLHIAHQLDLPLMPVIFPNLHLPIRHSSPDCPLSTLPAYARSVFHRSMVNQPHFFV